MAKGDLKLGSVRARFGKQRRGWVIDFGRRWGPRFLYSFHGVRFETKELAEAILSHVHMEISKGRELDDVMSEIAPEAASVSSVDLLKQEWLEGFARKVRIGDRAPRTLREYRRWAADDDTGYFRWWSGQSIWEIDAASVEVWSDWLAERGLSCLRRAESSAEVQ